MARDSRNGLEREERVEFGADTIEQLIRERVQAVIEAVVDAELDEALGADP